MQEEYERNEKQTNNVTEQEFFLYFSFFHPLTTCTSTTTFTLRLVDMCTHENVKNDFMLRLKFRNLQMLQSGV